MVLISITLFSCYTTVTQLKTNRHAQKRRQNAISEATLTIRRVSRFQNGTLIYLRKSLPDRMILPGRQPLSGIML
jgi:hypothetical protein